jgi:hypothetical protein
MAEDDGFVTASMANGPTGSGGGDDLAGEAKSSPSFSLRDASEGTVHHFLNLLRSFNFKGKDLRFRVVNSSIGSCSSAL